MRVDPEFHKWCQRWGYAPKVTKKLAKHKTVLSELISNEEYSKNVEQLYNLTEKKD